MTPTKMIAEMVADEKYNAVVVERWFDEYVVTLGYFHQGEIDGVEHKGKTIADAIAAMYEAWQKSKA